MTMQAVHPSYASTISVNTGSSSWKENPNRSNRPGIPVERVQEVQFKVIGFQPAELLGQEPIEVAGFLHVPRGHLRDELHPVAVPVGKRHAEHHLALPAVVPVGRVNVVHAAVDGAHDQPDRLGLVNRIGGTQGGKAHAPEAEGGNPPAGASEHPVRHLPASSVMPPQAMIGSRHRPETAA
jgi:hypothetical protein